MNNKDAIRVGESLIKMYSSDALSECGFFQERCKALTHLISLAKDYEQAKGMPKGFYSKLKEIVCYHQQNGNIKYPEGLICDLQSLFENNCLHQVALSRVKFKLRLPEAILKLMCCGDCNMGNVDKDCKNRKAKVLANSVTQAMDKK